jgi:ribosomal protein S18 acetylase RimI-like enzyme
MVTAAAMHGIDLSWMWGTVERSASRPPKVRQVCLVVPGSGRTAMCILSGPGGGGSAEQETHERAACVQEAIRFLSREKRRPGGRDLRLAQALPDPGETWAIRAYQDAGFLKVGELAYMRRQRTSGPTEAGAPQWPEGWSVRRVRAVGPADPDRALLIDVLDRSYEKTLDCPELCGLRETADVLESHKATGAFDPRLWWLLLEGEHPRGCVLLNRCPEHGTVELVYLGLAPEARGKGLGGMLLGMALAEVDAAGGTPMTCAVDLRNAPAIRLYERFGFREFGRRTALVVPIP